MKKTALILCLFAFLLLSGCGSKVPKNPVSSIGDMAGKTVGVIEGSASPVYLDTAGRISSYTSPETLLGDVKNAALDCAVLDKTVTDKVKTRGLRVLKEPLVDTTYHIAIARENPDLVKAVNEALSKLSEEGDLEAIKHAYLLGEAMPPMPTAENVSGTLTLAVTAEFPPYSYFDEAGDVAGLDIDVARAVCALLGADLEIKVIRPNEILTNVQYGKVDLAMGGLTPPEGEEESIVQYTNAYTRCTQVVIVRK
ncbi:MAG TPA: transporter substrate-binding domain-containing protein [Papillibacter sp.]|jgi:polar amino acid transport system substrate-binding protein|nr:transporter substrate-binding domain-containing protein [Papillibacter sp.]